MSFKNALFTAFVNFAYTKHKRILVFLLQAQYIKLRNLGLYMISLLRKGFNKFIKEEH
jgi:predicted small integral membrane protein